MLDVVALGAYLRYMRKRHHLTLETVAEATELSEKAIRNVEHGKSSPMTETTLILFDLYQIPTKRLKRYYRRSPAMNYLIKRYQIYSSRR